jgi:hypothetical protein
VRAWVINFIVGIVWAVAGCEKSKAHKLDLGLIRVSADARLRTDTVGVGNFEEQATFVLVDADNTAKEGAYVTLGGSLADADNHPLGTLRAQSLWIPAGETRTFALVDKERKPRPASARARIEVMGALVPAVPPPYHVGEITEREQDGRAIASGVLHNDANVAGAITLIASFHGPDGRPMTRPFTLLRVAPHGSLPVQMPGPPGSTHGTLFVGDAIYPSPDEIPAALDPSQFGLPAKLDDRFKTP